MPSSNPYLALPDALGIQLTIRVRLNRPALLLTALVSGEMVGQGMILAIPLALLPYIARLYSSINNCHILFL